MAQSYDFIFTKEGDMIYISHLDLIRLFARSARRAELPVELTKGFNPHFQIKIKKALKLGMISQHEEGQIVLSMPLEAGELRKRWQEQLPVGILIKEIRPAA